MITTNENVNSLRPYPIVETQDKVVARVVRIREKGVINRIEKSVSNLSERFDGITNFCSRSKVNDNNCEEKENNEINHPLVCSRIHAMDSKYLYSIVEGKLWFKPLSAQEDSKWKLFDENGYADQNQSQLIGVSADGDNLIVIDINQRISYAKTNHVVIEVSFDCLQWKIIKSNVKWKIKWFSMDGVCLIVNLFKNPILYSIENNRSISISHKGPDTMYYTDMNGKKHPDPYVGVTTIYTLNQDGRRIFFADPWLQNKFQNEITTPQDGQFIAESLDASASTIMLLQRAKDQFGQEINQIYTRFADFDSIGSNPALKSTYNINNKIPLIRYLPSEDWIFQPSIPIQGNARLTKNIAIIQTGWGQSNRQLRVQGQNQNGQNGYYFKNIYDTKWFFQIVNNLIIQQTEFLPEDFPHTGFEQGPAITEDYHHGTLVIPNLNIPLNISLEKFSRQGFNERGLHTKLILTFEDGFKLSLPLYARRSWKSLLGISSETIWKLIIPNQYFNYQNNQLQFILHRIFRNKPIHPVNLHQTENRIIINNVLGNFARFKFDFTNKKQ